LELSTSQTTVLNCPSNILQCRHFNRRKNRRDHRSKARIKNFANHFFILRSVLKLRHLVKRATIWWDFGWERETGTWMAPVTY
ncbi:MAG: hypothetical protein ABIU09_04935, partial [Pyrinomonadaceae bacterium]